VIKTIRESPDVETARQRLIENFNLSEIQAQAILDMQLRRLAALERQKIEDEHKRYRPHRLPEDLRQSEDPGLMGTIWRGYGTYGDERRTDRPEDDGLNEEDLGDEAVLISLTER
jgi:DNA gyrase subunit A